MRRDKRSVPAKAAGKAAPRRLGVGLACIATLMTWVSVASTPALGEVTRLLVSSFNGSDAPNGPFAGVGANAMDRSNGDLYVIDTGTQLVDKFAATGSYAGVQLQGTPQGSFSFGLMSGIAVDNAGGTNGGDVYVADTGNGVVDRFSSSGEYECQITGAEAPSATECNGGGGSQTPAGAMSPTGIAVSSGGDIYVADAANSVIDEFGPSGDYVTQISDPNIFFPATIGIDSTGDIYVTNFFSNVVEFNAAHEFVKTLDSNGPLSVGVDPSDEHVYVGDAAFERVAEYDASGNQLDQFGKNVQVLGASVATNPEDVYASVFNANAIEVFGPRVVIPDVTTGAAMNVRPSSATLSGTVNPDGFAVTNCQFEYVDEAHYEQFATDPYTQGAVVPCSASVGSGTENVAVYAGVNGLAMDTTYHFRLVAGNASGSNSGSDETLTTPGPPGISNESASATTTSANVKAQISPFGYSTVCELVEYVDEETFRTSGYASAATAPCSPVSLGSGFGRETVSAALGGLKIGTTYHFRFIASNQISTTTGPDQTFATFGIQAFSVKVVDAGGKPYTQAGGHPFEWTTTLDLNTSSTTAGAPGTDANIKDVETELPPGMVGNPNATPRCTRYNLTIRNCSPAAQVGVIHLRSFTGPVDDALYNIQPPNGIPAEFGAFINSGFKVFLDTHVKPGSYTINADATNAPTGLGVTGVTVDLWGVPADQSHDGARCAVPDSEDVCSGPEGDPITGPNPAGVPPLPFLTNPTSCGAPETVSVKVDSWQDPGAFASASAGIPVATNCESLTFTPAIAMQLDTSVADSPSGLDVQLRMPQEESSQGLAQPALKKTVVTLPVGMSVNPSGANGLKACTLEEMGLEDESTPTCPEASKIGRVTIDTPLLPKPLTGDAYFAEQGRNPFGSLLALYIAAAGEGVTIKLAGHVEADAVTGQLRTTFANTPQLPFSLFDLELFGGPLGVLATPDACGRYTASSEFTPWSAPIGGEVEWLSTLTINAKCVTGFAPGFAAGGVNPIAGGYTPFVLTVLRGDSDEEISGLTTTLPEGSLANISDVAECSDRELAMISNQVGTGGIEAANPSCPQASKVGTVRVAVGAGPDPLYLGGQVYLTGPYRGAPYGLAAVVPALAGPMDLGTVVVRAALHIDPRTVQITSMSDSLPTMLDGIPVRLRRIDVTLDRAGFMLNPTSCTPMSSGGTVTSVTGRSASIESRFQVGECDRLPFAPKFNMSAEAKASRINGVSLKVSVTSTPGQANIAKIKVSLPKQLPSRLTTLQKACAAAIFDVNPLHCPSGSVVGTAVASTPLLREPLLGQAYLVSHGGAAFPDLEMMLEGDGVVLILDGRTQIKQGITSVSFDALPDAPLAGFSLALPAGTHSLLATNVPAAARRGLCGVNLTAPVQITGHNGVVIKHRDRVVVLGCAARRAKAKRRARSIHR